MDDIKEALKIAANALDIASDWGIVDVKAHPPFEWGLKAYEEDEGEGWCSIKELAYKLRELRDTLEINNGT